MSFRSWLTKKASKTAETVIVQTKENLQKTMENKITDSGNLWFTVGKVGLLGLIFVLIMKDKNEQKESAPIVHPQPTSIVINNYMNERSERNDQEHH